ncbi:STAS domain-containing protein [Klenkia sp. PcliD-1-E]|uniref:STAS domain-containing protein n=1 Tax=Klenkia sp. PcliD-1-E TaxID=2954492 RepID=UPI0035AC0BDF
MGSTASHHAAVRVVDVAGVTFFGSAALAYLVRLARAASPARLQLHSPGRVVRRPWEITGAIGMLDVTEAPGPTTPPPGS